MSDDNNPAPVEQDGTVEAAAAVISGILDSPEESEGTTAEDADAPSVGDEAEAEEEQPASEAEGDSDDAEVTEEDGESDADDGEEPKGTPETYKVTIQGQTQEVTITELVNGYQRQSDYTRDKQALAAEKQAMERAVAEERERLLAKFEELDAMAQPAEPDWNALVEEDPIGAQRLYIQWDQHQKTQERLQAERQQLLEQKQADDRRRQQAFVKQQAERLLEMKPEWRDPEVAKKESGAITDFLGSVGYTQQEISNLMDPRAVQIAEDAMKYRALMARKTAVDKKVAKAPKVQKPGAAKDASAVKNEAIKAAKDRLRRSGSVRDAAALIANLE